MHFRFAGKVSRGPKVLLTIGVKKFILGCGVLFSAQRLLLLFEIIPVIYSTVKAIEVKMQRHQ